MERLTTAERIVIALLITVGLVAAWQGLQSYRTVQEQVPQNAELHAAAINVASRF